MFKPLVIFRYKFLANSSGSLQADQPIRPAAGFKRHTIECEFSFRMEDDSTLLERRAETTHE